MSVDKLKNELLAARLAINKVLETISSNPELLETVENTDRLADNEEADFMNTIMESWNNGLGSKCTLNRTVKQKLKARLKAYSKEDITESVRNRLGFVTRSKWFQEPANRHHKVDILHVIGTDQKLEKYLNSHSQKEIFDIKEVTIGKKEETNNNLLD